MDQLTMDRCVANAGQQAATHEMKALAPSHPLGGASVRCSGGREGGALSN
jgi:hypothetical protein